MRGVAGGVNSAAEDEVEEGERGRLRDGVGEGEVE